ncbi:c-type cytochrome [Hahella ganghwensis]|uniref:c-type cytochrome n=1 Tax=Hahella ganghwensis TaxID=286420 RepID=UPI00052563AD|nr:c-type cytochrome [Hahella ganghwensis]
MSSRLTAILISVVVTSIFLQSCSDPRHFNSSNYYDRSFSSNGERIYFTGKDLQGRPISTAGGHHHMKMHGGGCVVCHGEYREGGIRMWPWFWITAPPLTRQSLTGDNHDEEGHGSVWETHEHEVYDADSLARAITQGMTPNGERLDDLMPRWQMSKQDIEDLTNFLLSDSDHSHD